MKDILQIAREMEQDGIDYFGKLAAEAPHEKITEIFETLVKEEKRHIEVIDRLIKENPWRPQNKALADTPSVFDEIRALEFTFDDTSDLIANYEKSYKHAWDIEKKSAEFYDKHAAAVSDTSVKDVLHDLAEQEKGHMRLMETMLARVRKARG